MSQIFGPIRQLGYVVYDIEAEMRHWSTTLGVGPWFYAERVPVREFRYRGAPSPIALSVALANSGPLQVELIQTRNEAPSMYRDFLAAHHGGLQHVACWTENFDADFARARGHGLTVGMSGEVGERGRYVYFETESHPGSVVELSEIAGPKGTLFRMIREAAETWDGSDPIRPFPDLATLAANQ
ncbi:MAG TPA: VOC family protein [Acetobacteraceae bacterium]|nr:VOC family protein [Acetobacteraceae bacterium]